MCADATTIEVYLTGFGGRIPVKGHVLDGTPTLLDEELRFGEIQLPSSTWTPDDEWFGVRGGTVVAVDFGGSLALRLEPYICEMQNYPMEQCQEGPTIVIELEFTEGRTAHWVHQGERIEGRTTSSGEALCWGDRFSTCL